MRRAAKVAAQTVAGTSLVAVGLLYADFRRTYQRPHGWSALPTGALQPPAPPKRLISLTPQQLADFERDGYLVVKGVLPEPYLRALRDAALDYQRRYEGAQKPFDKYSGRNAIHLPSAHARWAWDFVSSVGGLGIGLAASQLLAVADGGDPAVAATQPPPAVHCVFDSLDVIVPGQRSAHRAPFRKEASGHRPSLRAWVPLEDVSPSNGATVIVPGSHRWEDGECFMGHGPCGMCFPGVLATPRCPSFDEITAPGGRYRPVVLPVEVGDVVFLDPKTLHGWGPNDTAAPRLAMRLHLKSEAGLREFAAGDTAAKARSPLGKINLLLQGWTPLHPVDFSALAMPRVYPPQPREEGGGVPPPPPGWPVEEPSFAEYLVFALGSGARYAAWRVLGDARVLQPPPEPGAEEAAPTR